MPAAPTPTSSPSGCCPLFARGTGAVAHRGDTAPPALLWGGMRGCVCVCTHLSSPQTPSCCQLETRNPTCLINNGGSQIRAVTSASPGPGRVAGSRASPTGSYGAVRWEGREEGVKRGNSPVPPSLGSTGAARPHTGVLSGCSTPMSGAVMGHLAVGPAASSGMGPDLLSTLPSMGAAGTGPHSTLGCWVVPRLLR